MSLSILELLDLSEESELLNGFDFEERVKSRRRSSSDDGRCFEKKLELLGECFLGSSKVELSEEKTEDESIRVEESGGDATVDDDEEISTNDGQPRRRFLDSLEVGVGSENEVEDVEESSEGEGVEVVDLPELFEDEVDHAASSSEREVLLRDLLDFVHHDVRFLDLLGDLGGFPLERLERIDDLVVVEDVSAGLVEGLEE